MEKRCVEARNAAPAVGPYSHAVKAGNLVFVSGQCPFAKDGSGLVSGDFDTQARVALDNLKTVLEAAGSSLNHVVKTVVFIADMDNFGAFNSIYAEYFGEEPPARSCVQAARLPKDAPVEIEAIAITP
jgi:2-iminobutanoate/2-iminopropanoate deaminase